MERHVQIYTAIHRIAGQPALIPLRSRPSMNAALILLGIASFAFAVSAFRVLADVYVRQSPIPFVAAWLTGLVIAGALGRWLPRFAQLLGGILMALFVLHLLLHISAG